MIQQIKARGLSNPALIFGQAPDSPESFNAPVVDEHGQLRVVLYDHLGRSLSSSGMGGLIVQDLITEWQEHLIVGVLTSDGVQWGAGEDGGQGSFTTVTVNTWYEAFRKRINPYTPPGRLLSAELAFTISLAANADNSTGEWQWQASNDGVNWHDLHPVVAEADIDIAAVERTRSGYARMGLNFDASPFYVRLMVRCTSAGDTVTARVKNSSYALIKVLPS